MKIKTTSWHYRLLCFFNVESVKYASLGPVSLCRYFWLVVLWLGIAAAIVATAAVVASTMLFTAYALLTLVAPLPLPALTTADDLTIFGAMLTFGSLFWIVFLTGFVTVLQQETRIFSRALDRVLPTREAADRPPSLLVSWLRAKKEKVCPVIEFEDTQ